MSLLRVEFKNEHLSVSRLKLYEQCAYAFWCRYVSPGERLPAGDAAGHGIVLHAALEATYLWIVENEYEGLFPDEVLFRAYRDAWRESALTTVSLYQEGLDMLRTYAASHPLVDHFNILAVEREFNVAVDGFTMNGYIDRIDKVDDDEIVIVDYKSNRKLFSRGELINDIQMSIYGYAARELYPWAKRVSFEFHMLRFDTVQRATRTAAAIDDAAAYVASLGWRTEHDAEWAPKLNENCSYCDHRRRCPKYVEVLAGQNEIPRAEDTDDLAAVSIEREHVANLAKVYYGRKETLDRVLRRALEEREELQVAGRTYKFQNANETVFEPERTVRAFMDAGIPIETVAKRLYVIDKTAVEDFRVEVIQDLDRSKALMLNASIEAAATKIPMTPRLDSRANKKLVASQVTKEKM